MALTGMPAIRRKPGSRVVRSRLSWERLLSSRPAATLLRPSGDALLLAAVSVCYVVLQLLLTDPGRGSLSWDESIYFSQVDPRSPATYFSAPRSRGAGLIAAPVALFTSSPLAIRIYLAVLSGVLLFLVFGVWRRIVGGGTAALAALLFSTLWVAVDYGSQLMPNIWSAFAAVAATGLFLRAVREGLRPRVLLGMAFAIAWVALIRAPDGFWAGLPLLAASLLVKPWRRPAVWAALVGGLVAGLAEWTIEAYVRFGGIVQRLADSDVVEGGMTPNWNVTKAFRTADGPLLCRPCLIGDPQLTPSAWWLAIPVLVLLALVVARRTGRPAVAALPAVVALSVSVPYLFLITYSAPRFLLPAYALLALPIAALLTHGLRIVRRRPTPTRVVAVAVVGVLFAGHLAVQEQIQYGHGRAAVTDDGQYRALADALRRIGIRPPCLVAGNTEPIAYDDGCSSSLTSDPHSDSSMASGPGVVRAARHESVAILVPPWGMPAGYGPRDYAPDWRRVPLTGSPRVAGWSAYVPPSRS